MLRRRALLVAMFALAVAVSTRLASATEVYQGRVVNAGNGQISIETQTRSRLIFQLAPNASVTRNGKAVKLESLKKNDRANVTTNNRMLAVLIDARTTEVPPTPARPPAKVADSGPRIASVDLYTISFDVHRGDGVVARQGVDRPR